MEKAKNKAGAPTVGAPENIEELKKIIADQAVIIDEQAAEIEALKLVPPTAPVESDFTVEVDGKTINANVIGAHLWISGKKVSKADFLKDESLQLQAVKSKHSLIKIL